MSIQQIPDPTNELISAAKVQEELDVSAPTLRRRERQGLLTPINIYGKKYYRRDEVAEFERRAIAGEFASPPRGAAALKAKWEKK
jgi:hypothetical protein